MKVNTDNILCQSYFGPTKVQKEQKENDKRMLDYRVY